MNVNEFIERRVFILCGLNDYAHDHDYTVCPADIARILTEAFKAYSIDDLPF